MILTQEDIKTIILDNPGKELIQAGRKYNKAMRLHLYGEGMDSHLTEIKGMETPALRQIRVKYAKNNKDVMSRLKRPIDKVFSARGGSVYYNLSDSQSKEAMNYTQNLRGGLSTKKWIETHWLPHFLDDPNGVLFMEIDAQGNSYPTYKSTGSIYDYQVTGNNIEYIVFEVTKSDKKKFGLKEDDIIYRLVDDARDYIVKREGEDVTILSNLTIQNYFGFVPALLNSDIHNPAGEGMLSLFDEIITLADDYLLTGSIRTTHKFLHGFPKYWQYAPACNVCQGMRTVDGADCKACNGSGKSSMTSPSDAMLLDVPVDKDSPTIAPNVGGYVEPSDIYNTISTQDLATLEDAMNFTIWGKSTQKQAQGPSINPGDKTATQILDEVKPEESRLTPISESAEKRHKFIIDCIVDVKLRQGYTQSGGSSVNYGRRYMLEGADVILAKYNEARAKGAAISVLDDLLIDYLETEYAGDPVKMVIKLKEMQIEPFVHKTTEQVDAAQSITGEDKAAKMYYSEWRRTVNEAMILSFDTDLLREQLYAYAKEKAATVQEAKDKEAEQKIKPAA